LGKATQQAIDTAVAFIISKMEALPFQGKVLSVKGDQIHLNVGERNGVHSGDRFLVCRPGEIIVDSDSGEVRGSEEKHMGVVRISQINENFSTGTKIQGKKILKGDILRSKWLL